jgi:CheY-like chemotaxis protein
MIILAIDNDPEDIDLFVDAVKEIDPAITCAAVYSGHEALRFLEEAQELPDIIFLDINMPGMNGKECLLEIRKNPRYHEIPIIMYSTNTNGIDHVDFVKFGADFLAKANDYTSLKESLKYTIDKHT